MIMSGLGEGQNVTQVDQHSARSIRQSLDHPVIDADGHFMEFMPLVNDEILSYLEERGGLALADRFREGSTRGLDTVAFESNRASDAVVKNWRAMSSWWGNPVADPRERATAHLPRLLYDRLDELGVDLMLTYPSWTLGFMTARDPELRAGACWAVNRYVARLFEPYRDRLRPAALIPMQTPDEAVTEIDHAVGQLGFSLVVLGGHAFRPIGDSDNPDVFRLDVFGLDSAYDYDPVWAACVRNRVAPVFHSSVQNSRPSRSITNYSYNHMAAIAQAHEALCKALFMGGVYRRFPQLRFGYLEGGVMWGASLLADLIGHWDKRGGHAIEQLDPARLDVAAVMALVRQHGTEDMVAKSAALEQDLSRPPSRLAELDDFAAAGIAEPADILTPFAERSFFGCEADDPLMGLAFKLHIAHTDVRLRPLLGTDVSHWDAPVMNEVIPEAYEAITEGAVSEAEFREFAFVNPVLLHGGVNPEFFDGTVCEKAARAELPG
jgi:predicted TIM-barrel fold metal-dependent hydrolase